MCHFYQIRFRKKEIDGKRCQHHGHKDRHQSFDQLIQVLKTEQKRDRNGIKNYDPIFEIGIVFQSRVHTKIIPKLIRGGNEEYATPNQYGQRTPDRFCQQRTRRLTGNSTQFGPQ